MFIWSYLSRILLFFSLSLVKWNLKIVRNWRQTDYYRSLCLLKMSTAFQLSLNSMYPFLDLTWSSNKMLYNLFHLRFLLPGLFKKVHILKFSRQPQYFFLVHRKLGIHFLSLEKISMHQSQVVQTILFWLSQPNEISKMFYLQIFRPAI